MHFARKILGAYRNARDSIVCVPVGDYRDCAVEGKNDSACIPKVKQNDKEVRSIFTSSHEPGSPRSLKLAGDATNGAILRLLQRVRLFLNLPRSAPSRYGEQQEHAAASLRRRAVHAHG